MFVLASLNFANDNAKKQSNPCTNLCFNRYKSVKAFTKSDKKNYCQRQHNQTRKESL